MFLTLSCFRRGTARDDDDIAESHHQQIFPGPDTSRYLPADFLNPLAAFTGPQTQFKQCVGCSILLHVTHVSDRINGVQRQKEAASSVITDAFDEAVKTLVTRKEEL